MNNVFVYCEMEGAHVADVSLELLTKGRKLATQLGCQLETICAGTDLADVEKQVLPYGVDRVHVFDAPGLFPYTSLPHTSILVNLFKEEKPQICLMGATVIGRDLGPRVSSALTSGLTADCTQLEIGNHEDKKNGITYENLLYQIRPAFGGNIVATIINPEHRPQMATVREGVMKKEIVDANYQGEVIRHDVAKYVPETDYVVKVIDRHVEKAKHNLKGAPIVIAGGYGMGSKEGFDMLFELAKELHAEVGASRAAVDAGFCDHDRQIGQTGVTVHPKLYIACGISGQIQHIAGMQDAGIIISVNSDPNAPINSIADYVINGTVEEVIPKMIIRRTASKANVLVMKRRLLFILFLSSQAFSAFSQDTVYLDKKGRWTENVKEAIRYCIPEKLGENEIEVKFYNMGDTLLNLRRFSTFVSNPKQCVQNGKSISYYANGEPAVTADFENGHREGEMRRFYKNGKLKYVCWFSKGKRDGELTMYYPNGSVWRTENYEEGKLLDGHVYNVDGKEVPFYPSDRAVGFPGGEYGLRVFIREHLHYPQAAWEQKIEGQVMVRLVFDKKGRLGKYYILPQSSENYFLRQEAVRLVEEDLKKIEWQPAVAYGEFISMGYVLPLNFKLPKPKTTTKKQ